ncbi:hypothetical protein G9A89_002700 [Geosiphon pyriformis]|nr:hypothetical protein G9A89_002700 [Geosiphon pyriformis]
MDNSFSPLKMKFLFQSKKFQRRLRFRSGLLDLEDCELLLASLFDEVEEPKLEDEDSMSLELDEDVFDDDSLSLSLEEEELEELQR